MRYLVGFFLLAISSRGVLAIPQGIGTIGSGAASPKLGGPSGGKAVSAGGTAKSGGGKGLGGMGDAAGLFGTLKELGPTLNAVLGQPAKPPSGCASLEVLVARGTYEPGPYGFIVGDPLLPMIKAKVQGARGYNVQYPADFSATSSTQGISDVVKRLNQQVKECPNEKLVMVGYSQGAGVMRAAAAKLDASVQQKVIAFVMYGDPGRKAGGLPPTLKGRLFENCAGGDFCGNGSQGGGHLSYRDGTWHKDSSSFIVAAFNGSPLPARP